MSKSLSLMVFLKKQKKDCQGNVPLYVRVTVDGAKDDFSLGHKVQPSEWNQEKQLLTGKSQESRLANSKIAQMKGTITRIFQSIPPDEKVTGERLIDEYFGDCRKNGSDQPVKDPNFPATVDSLIEKYRGLFNRIKVAKAIPGNDARVQLIQVEIEGLIKDIQDFTKISNKWLDDVEIEKTLSDAFHEFLLNYLLQVAKGVSSFFTLKKWISTRNKVFQFVQYRYGSKDIALNDIELKFAETFKDYLILTDNVANNATMKYLKNVKQVIGRAKVHGWMSKNPLSSFKCTYKDPEREALTLEELAKAIKHDFTNPRLREVRDVFVFCCFTGFAYQEVYNLRSKELIQGIDKKLWINTNRNKTRNPEFLPLLPMAEDIIKKYSSHPYCQKYNKLLPVNSNQKFNEYLKEIGALCGVAIELTTHTARHTFATTIAIENDIPIKIVSVMMGHKTVRTTEIYTRPRKKAISRHMGRVEGLLFGSQRGLIVDGKPYELDMTPTVVTKAAKG